MEFGSATVCFVGTPNRLRATILAEHPTLNECLLRLALSDPLASVLA